MTWKALLISLILSAAWCFYIFCIKPDYIWLDFCRDGLVWSVACVIVAFGLLQELKYKFSLLCAVLCAAVFYVPFLWVALAVAFPEMIIPILFGTVGVTLCAGIGPVIIWMDTPSNEKETA